MQFPKQWLLSSKSQKSSADAACKFQDKKLKSQKMKYFLMHQRFRFISIGSNLAEMITYENVIQKQRYLKMKQTANGQTCISFS